MDPINVWFIRFGMDSKCTTLGCGNLQGGLSLFNFSGLTFADEAVEVKIPANTRVKGLYVRQVAFNFDASLMVAATDKCNVLVYKLSRVPWDGPRKVKHDTEEWEDRLEEIMDNVPEGPLIIRKPCNSATCPMKMASNGTCSASKS